MELSTLLVMCLATWRASSLLVKEAGPFSVFKKLRELTGIEHDQNGVAWRIPDTFFAGLLSCVWCASVWVGAFWIAGLYFLPDVTFPVTAVLALSAVAILLDRFFNGQTTP